MIVAGVGMLLLEVLMELPLMAELKEEVVEEAWATFTIAAGMDEVGAVEEIEAVEEELLEDVEV